MSTFERMPFQARNAVFKKLSEITDIAALSKDEREKYDESLKVMRDYHATLEGAALLGRREGLEEGLAEGREKGLAEGREKGLAEGRAEGREKGLAEGRAETAKMMLEDGEPISKIMRYTGLTEEEIEKLR